jgi:integrase
MRGATYKRCACRDEDGRQLGSSCPLLGRRKGHGSWYFVMAMPSELGRQRQLKRGGFALQSEAQTELENARSLLQLAQQGDMSPDQFKLLVNQRPIPRANDVASLVRRGVDVADSRTVEGWLNYWLEQKSKKAGTSAVGRPIRPTTARSYAQHVKSYLIPELGHLELSKLRNDHIAAAYDNVQAANPRLGPATLHRIHRTLSSALNAAVKARRIEFNPASLVHLPEVRRPQVRPWEPAELGKFLDFVAGDELGALFEVIAATGMRRGEALGLRWSDIDLEVGVITVRQQLVESGAGRFDFGPPKTASGEGRQIELGQATMGALMAHRFAQDAERASWGEAYNDEGLVFASEGGGILSPERVTKRFTKLSNAAGVRTIRLHDLRHGAASLMLAAGVPVEIVSKRLGHASIAITVDTYSHLLEGVGRQAADAAMALVPRQSSRSSVPTSFPQGPPEAGGSEAVLESLQVDDGGPRGTRTHNPRIKSPLLCQLS